LTQHQRKRPARDLLTIPPPADTATAEWLAEHRELARTVERLHDNARRRADEAWRHYQHVRFDAAAGVVELTTARMEWTAARAALVAAELEHARVFDEERLAGIVAGVLT
jgi:hypothetical protein